jgi:hypothetical protein
MSAELLRDLARAKVAFQLRAIETIIRGPASRIEARSDETPSAAQPVGQEPDGDSRDAQTPSGGM